MHSSYPLSFPIENSDRSIGANLSGHILRHKNLASATGEPTQFEFYGAAGQSFGAFLIKPLSFHLHGEANDYVGKSLSGGVNRNRSRPRILAKRRSPGRQHHALRRHLRRTLHSRPRRRTFRRKKQRRPSRSRRRWPTRLRIHDRRRSNNSRPSRHQPSLRHDRRPNLHPKRIRHRRNLQRRIRKSSKPRRARASRRNPSKSRTKTTRRPHQQPPSQATNRINKPAATDKTRAHPPTVPPRRDLGPNPSPLGKTPSNKTPRPPTKTKLDRTSPRASSLTRIYRGRTVAEAVSS